MDGGLSYFFNSLVNQGIFSRDSTYDDVRAGETVRNAVEPIAATVETIQVGTEEFTKYIYYNVDDFVAGLEELTGEALDRTLIDEAMSAGRLVAEQSELLHDLVNNAHADGFNPNDPETIEAMERVTEIEQQLGNILEQNPDIMDSVALRTAFGAGKAGEFVAATVGGGALVAFTGWTGAGGVVGAASTVYGTHLAYEIGYGDMVRESIFDEGGIYYGENLYAVLDNADAVEWLDDVATNKGMRDGAIALGGAVVPFGAGRLASMGVQRLGIEGAQVGVAGVAGAGVGQAGFTYVVTGDLRLAAMGLALPPSIAFIPRYALQDPSTDPDRTIAETNPDIEAENSGYKIATLIP